MGRKVRTADAVVHETGGDHFRLESEVAAVEAGVCAGRRACSCSGAAGGGAGAIFSAESERVQGDAGLLRSHSRLLTDSR